MSSPRLLTSLILLTLLLSSCTRPPESCPLSTPADLSQADTFARDNGLPFRFPLDGFSGDTYTNFGACNEGPGARREYHAAEDFLQPAGTRVYAMADGEVSFSDPMGGYGWLIIIDHPQANLYSLYGHLSPSRWRTGSGPVKKGELIAYLGDSDENGGSSEHPLAPHLHFGVRAGQRVDYPGMGEWRWQAGWVEPCPQSLGWLQPSAVITSQHLPPGGFPKPASGFLAIWGSELFVSFLFLIGGMSALLFATKKGQFLLLTLYGGLAILAGWIAMARGARAYYVLLALGILSVIVGLCGAIRRFTRPPPAQS